MGNQASALHEATRRGDIQAVRILLQQKSGSATESDPETGVTALHIAAAQNYDVIIRELLARGAAPNAVDKHGFTPLHLAASQGHLEAVKSLLRNSADPERKDMNQKTAYDYALERGHQAVAQILREAAWYPGSMLGAQDSPTKAGRLGTPTYSGTPTGAHQAPRNPWQSPTTVQNAAGGPLAAAHAGTGPPNQTHGPQEVYGQYAGGTRPPQLVVPAGPQYPQPNSRDIEDLPSAPPAPSYIDYIRPQRTGDLADVATANGQAPGAIAEAPLYPAVPSAAHPLPPAAYNAGGGGVFYPEDISRWPSVPNTQPQYPARPPQGEAPSTNRKKDDDDWAPKNGDDWDNPAGPRGPTTNSQGPAKEPWLQASAAPYGPAPEPATAHGVGSSGPSTPSTPAGTHVGPVLPPKPSSPSSNHQDGVHAKKKQQQAGLDPGRLLGGLAGMVLKEINKRMPGGGLPPTSSTSEGSGGLSEKTGPPPGPHSAPHIPFSLPGGAPPAPVATQWPAYGSLEPPSIQDLPPTAPGPSATMAGPTGRVYSYQDLLAATNGFAESNKIGSGGYGPVYRGYLDGTRVAVKVLEGSNKSMQGMKEFQSEVNILSRIHHPHVVLLIGSCPERGILVYELMEYGSLEDHLFRPTLPDLHWTHRVRITMEVASALTFLHSAPQPVIHMDLKPANVLLSKALVSKVGDVGLSRLAPALASPQVSVVQDSQVVGTATYMDPEYWRTGKFGPKSDVYSLGMVMLQLLTGKDASEVIALVETALQQSRQDVGSFARVMDHKAGAWPVTEALPYAHMAIKCVSLSRVDRPDLRTELLPVLVQMTEKAKLYGTEAEAQKTSNKSASSQTPTMFICPITQDVMEDPVFAADGYTYERMAIASWMQGHNTSPMTNLTLEHKYLTPNLALRSAIKEWEESR